MSVELKVGNLAVSWVVLTECVTVALTGYYLVAMMVEKKAVLRELKLVVLLAFLKVEPLEACLAGWLDL